MANERPRRTGRRLCLLASVATLVVAGNARAQRIIDRDSLTWPRISVSVGSQNGQVVAVGRARDASQRVVWRTPLGPSGPGIAVQQGWGTVFVRVGSRQYVIDDATGHAVRLRPGQVWRQPWPPLPPGTSTTPPPPPQETPAGPLDATAQANRQLLEALRHLEVVHQLRRQRRASREDLKRAERSVEIARQALAQAQERAIAKLRGGPAEHPGSPAPRPAGPPAKPPTLAEAEKQAMDLAAEYARAVAARDGLRDRPASDPAGKQALAEAEKAVRAASERLQAAEQQLQKLRTAAGAAEIRSLDPAQRARLAQAEQRIPKLVEDYDQAHRQVLSTQAAFERKLATPEELTAAQTRLLEALKELSEARRALAELRRGAAP